MRRPWEILPKSIYKLLEILMTTIVTDEFVRMSTQFDSTRTRIIRRGHLLAVHWNQSQGIWMKTVYSFHFVEEKSIHWLWAKNIAAKSPGSHSRHRNQSQTHPISSRRIDWFLSNNCRWITRTLHFSRFNDVEQRRNIHLKTVKCIHKNHTTKSPHTTTYVTIAFCNDEWREKRVVEQKTHWRVELSVEFDIAWSWTPKRDYAALFLHCRFNFKLQQRTVTDIGNLVLVRH